MFTLAPATRWGYFVYPLALIGWLLLTRPGTEGSTGLAIEIPVQAGGEQQHVPAAAR
jgi:hypothetical protein